LKPELDREVVQREKRAKAQEFGRFRLPSTSRASCCVAALASLFCHRRDGTPYF